MGSLGGRARTCQRSRVLISGANTLFSQHSQSPIVDPPTSVRYGRDILHSRHARKLNPRNKTAEIRILYVVVSALVIFATAWTVKFALTVDDLRDEIGTRDGWLIEMRGIERLLVGDPDEDLAASPQEASETARRLADDIRPSDTDLALKVEDVAHLVADQNRALAATREVVDLIRLGNTETSDALGAQIGRLNQMVAIVALYSGLIVILFGWGVSRQRLAGRAMRRAEALTLQMDYLAASSPAMLYTAHSAPPHDYAFVSPNVARIFGLPAEQLTQDRGRRSWIHPDDESKAERGLALAEKLGRHVQEYRVQTVKGDYRWVRDEVCTPEKDSDLMVGCIIDITDRRVADAALKEAMASMEVRVREAVVDVEANAEQLEAIVEAAMDAVLLVEEDGLVLQANRACGAIFGHEPSELTEEKVSMLFEGDDWSAPGVGAIEERVGRRSDGTSVPVEITTGRTAGVFGKPLLVLVVRDISERVEARMLLEERNAALASTNADLKIFTAAASHDMKEPLRKIRAFAGLLGESDEELSDSTLQYVSYMSDAAGRLTHLVDDLVEYAQAGRNTLHFESVSLDDLLGYVMDDLEVSISESDARIELAPLGDICADSHQLRRVFQNLIANGIRYSKPDRPPTISLTREEGDGVAFVIVRDEGIGFEPEYAEHIFAPFKRLSRSTSTEATGIGLAICRKIVHGHGGTIVADGVPGQGATFTIELPLGGHPVVQYDA